MVASATSATNAADPSTRGRPSQTADVLRNIGAASAAGACQISIFHPLDCLRIRFQLAGGDAVGWVAFTMNIVKSEGWWNGLHRPGLAPNILAVSGSQGLRLGLYPFVRDGLMGDRHDAVRPDLMMAAGLVSGSLAYFCAAPLWLIKTRRQAAAQLSGGAAHIELPTSLGSYWTGCMPLVVRGAMLTSGHMAGYDGTKRLMKQQGWLADGPVLHVAAATIAGFSAATLSAPADVFQTRLQTGASSSALTCLAGVWQADGLAGFFRGWTMNVVRLVPTFTVGSIIFEQTRRLFGLEYFE